MATTSKYQLQQPNSYLLMNHNASQSHGQADPSSCGWLDRIDPVVMSTCLPSFVIARVSARTRIGFFFVFLVCFLLYLGGIASFIAATRLRAPALTTSGERTNIGLVVAMAWGTYLSGPWTTLVTEILWAANEGLNDEVRKGHYKMGETAFYLLLVHLSIQIVLSIVMLVVIRKLRVRKSRSCIEVCSWGCFCCCCPPCALGTAVASANKARDTTIDEIPAFPA